MFKKVLSLFLILILLQTAFAIRLVDPVNKELLDNDFIGAVSPGSTLELIVSKDFGKFNSFKLTQDLPSDFKVSIIDAQESFKVYIKVPTTVALTDYQLIFDMNGKNASETVVVYFSVSKGLMDASFDNYGAESEVGKKADFKVTLVNNSYADEYFTIIPNLSWYWKTAELGKEFSATKILVPKRSTITDSFSIYPRSQGVKTFDTKIIFGNSGESKVSTLKVNATTNFFGKLDSVIFGLPFYSFSLMPSYLLNGLFGFLVN